MDGGGERTNRHGDARIAQNVESRPSDEARSEHENLPKLIGRSMVSSITLSRSSPCWRGQGQFC